MHQNFVFCLWASITAAILLGMISERALSKSKVMPLQTSAAMIFIPIAGRTHPAEIDPTPKRRQIAKF